MLADLDQRLTRLDRPRDHGGQLHRLFVQIEFRLRDPRNVEQIVDHAVEVVHLAFDDFARPLHGRIGRILQTQHLDGIPNGCQRVSQLVRQNRQELVLPPIRLFERRRLLFQSALGLAALFPAGVLEFLQVNVAPIHVGDHACRNRLIQRQADGQNLAIPEVPIQILLEEIEDHQPQDLVIANHLGKGPADFPALLAVRRSRQAMLIRVRIPRFGQAASQLAQKVVQMVLQHDMVGAGHAAVLRPRGGTNAR